MSTATATKKQGRPARSQERAEAEALARIATLAAHALRVLRDHGGEYPSENQLRSWPPYEGYPRVAYPSHVAVL